MVRAVIDYGGDDVVERAVRVFNDVVAKQMNPKEAYKYVVDNGIFPYLGESFVLSGLMIRGSRTIITHGLMLGMTVYEELSNEQAVMIRQAYKKMMEYFRGRGGD